MVLKANTAPRPAAEFEDTVEGEIAAGDAMGTEGDEPEEISAPAPVKGLAVAVKKPASVPSTKLKPKFAPADFDVISGMENALPPVEFGEGVRLVASNGNIMDGDKRILGEWIDFQLLSWNNRWVISPGGEAKDEEAKGFARYSMDGETTTRGEPIPEYMEMVKRSGYSKVALKLYVDLFGVLRGSAKSTEHVGKTVSISLSPDSVKAFSGFRRDVTVGLMLGSLEMPDLSGGLLVKVGTEIKSGNGNSWTKFTFSL